MMGTTRRAGTADATTGNLSRGIMSLIKANRDFLFGFVVGNVLVVKAKQAPRDYFLGSWT